MIIGNWMIVCVYHLHYTLCSQISFGNYTRFMFIRLPSLSTKTSTINFSIEVQFVSE